MRIDSRGDGDFSPIRYWSTIMLWSLGVGLALVPAVLAALKLDDYLAGGGTGDLAIAMVAAIALSAAAFALWRWRPDFWMGEPDTPRGRRMRRLGLACGLVGVIVTVPLSAASNRTDEILLFGNGPVPPVAAAIALAIWALSLPALIVLGRRNMDEVASKAHEFGMSIGFQVFAYAAPIWWMGWRGGFFPQPDLMIMFVATLAVATIVSIWRRST